MKKYKVYLSFTSDRCASQNNEFQIKTIKDLLDLIGEYPYPAIVEIMANEELSIEIYDDWRE